jgi:hypothetical protein
LKANRLGVAALNAARAPSEIGAVKFESSRACAASARSPRIRLTVLFCRSCAPVPVPLSV